MTIFKRFLVKVQLLELVELEDDVAEIPTGDTSMWLISAKDRDEAFDRSMKYFLQGAPKAILNGDLGLNVVGQSESGEPVTRL